MLHALLHDVAAHERVQQADAWCTRWHLDAAWLRAWSLFALLRWQIGRECTAAECAHGCAAAHADTARGARPIRQRDVESRYLLSGFARCSSCGGTLSVVSGAHGRARAFYYGCLAYHHKKSSCGNGLVLPVAMVDEAVPAALAGDVLGPPVVLAIVDAVFQALQPTATAARLIGLRADLRDVERKIEHLTAAIEQGTALAPLVAQLQVRQAEREGVLAAIAAAEAMTQLEHDRPRIEQQVLDGPLKFTPEGRSYRFEGTVTTGRLIAGLVLPPCVASPTGFEPVFWP